MLLQAPWIERHFTIRAQLNINLLLADEAIDTKVKQE